MKKNLSIILLLKWPLLEKKCSQCHWMAQFYNESKINPTRTFCALKQGPKKSFEAAPLSTMRSQIEVNLESFKI